jgi:hypothetical protein
MLIYLKLCLDLPDLYFFTDEVDIHLIDYSRHAHPDGSKILPKSITSFFVTFWHVFSLGQTIELHSSEHKLDQDTKF